MILEEKFENLKLKLSRERLSCPKNKNQRTKNGSLVNKYLWSIKETIKRATDRPIKDHFSRLQKSSNFQLITQYF